MDALQGRNYSLSFSYKGAFSPSQGLYRSASFRYDDMGVEKESVLLVTQLEQFGARHLLPCLDEPDKKVQAPKTSPHSMVMPIPEDALTRRPYVPGVVLDA